MRTKRGPGRPRTDRCPSGHLRTEANTFYTSKPSGGVTYVVRNCRMCHRIRESIRWYYGKRANTCGNFYRGVPPTVEEIARRVERRWQENDQ